MPIHGLTDKGNTPVETSQLGKAWKGKKKTQNIAGEDLKDKFRIDVPPPFDGIIRAKYGTMQPTELRVFFPHAETDKVFETWNDAKTVQGQMKRCNGERIIQQVVLRTSYRGGKPYPKRCRETCDLPCSKKENEVICKDCVSTGYLKFYIRELFGVAGMQQVIVQTVTGINDVVGVTKQLRAFEEKYGSLSKSSIPSPATWNYVPFVLRRVPRDISRPLYNKEKKSYGGGYGRSTAWPIVITEDPEWLAFWQDHMRRQMILQMVEQGQVALLQPADLALYQQMSKLELPMASPQALPVANEQKAIASVQPETFEKPALLPNADAQETIAVEPVVDTFESANQEASEEYLESMLARGPKDRVDAVNESLQFDKELIEELWGQVNQKLDGISKTSELIEFMLLRYAEGHMVTQTDAMKLLVRLQDDLGVVDEDLAKVFVAELPNHIRPAQKSQAEQFNNVSID